MKFDKEKIVEIISGLDDLIQSSSDLEKKYADKISRVHPDYAQSARNLVHYLAIRQHDVSVLQQKLTNFGLMPFHRIEAHVMRSLLFTRMILKHLIGETDQTLLTNSISFRKSQKIINSNTRELFGKKPKKRRTRIMVTMPSEMASDETLAERFIRAGMNCARINCAHDSPDEWLKIIESIRAVAAKEETECKIMMDLSGPKLRTGPMSAGPKVIRIRPERDDLGAVTKPAALWLSNPEFQYQSETFLRIPVYLFDLDILQQGDYLTFTDARNKTCTLEVIEKRQKGFLVSTYDSAYLETGTRFYHKTGSEELPVIATVGELPPVEQAIILKTGDKLYLHNNPEIPGQPAKYDAHGRLISHASIACAMPDVFIDVKPGEPILFDDGKIEGIIESSNENELSVIISNAKDSGAKLRAEKGINFPLSDLKMSGLTEKDCEDLKFVVQHADAVNVSFVNDPEMVAFIINQFEKLGKQPGLILKIETQKGFRNLPLILLEAMQVKPIGVMIARGDLAIETGWNNMATIQEEILRVCGAAHIPDIWATQVLESMAKKGIPSRAEITDAGVSERAECVMLNKGPQITKAIKLLDKILFNMELISDQEGILPQIEKAGELLLQ